METAVVILNYNGVQFLEKFCSPLLENTKEATIIVVDNQSTDNSVEYLKQNHPTIELIINKENGGFSKGYNDGLQAVKGRFKYYVLLNSDVLVTKDWLTPLVNKLKENKNIVGVQPKILSYHRKDYFEYAGASGGFMDRNFYPFCRGRIFDELEEDRGQYNNEKEVFWTSGACMVVKANIFHALGGLDEVFFAHMEEIDFCWRAKKRNLSFFVVPSSKVYHVGGGTLNYNNPNKTFLNFRNSLFTIHKNYDGWLFGKIFYRLSLDGVQAIRYLTLFKFKHFGAILKAHFHYYNRIFVLNQQRQEISQNSTKFNAIGLYKSSMIWSYFFKGIKKFSALNKRFFSSNL